MAVLAADANVETVGHATKCSFSANGADTFYRGAVLYADTGGGVQLVPAAGDQIVGIVAQQVTTTAAGDEVEAYVDGVFWMPVGTNITAADEGTRIVNDMDSTQSDNVADFVSQADITVVANDQSLGYILRVTATQMLIKVQPSLALGALDWL